MFNICNFVHKKKNKYKYSRLIHSNLKECRVYNTNCLGLQNVLTRDCMLVLIVTTIGRVKQLNKRREKLLMTLTKWGGSKICKIGFVITEVM